MTDKENPKSSSAASAPKIDPALLMALMKQQAQGKGAQVAGGPQIQLFGKKINIKETAMKVLNNMAKLVVYIDRLINFITKPEDGDRNELLQAARAPILFGFYIITFFVVLGGIWASCAPLDSASVAIGTVIANTNKKEIQHPEGGIVKDIFVKQGDIVQAEQPLIELDDVRAKANYDNAINMYRAFLAAENRLMAERDNLNQVEFADFLTKDISLPAVAKLLDTQRNLFSARKESFEKSLEGEVKGIEQAQKQIEGFEARKTSALKKLEYLKDRESATKRLLQKGFVTKDALANIEVNAIEAVTAVQSIDSEIERVQEEIKAREIRILNLKVNRSSEVLKELETAQQRTDEAEIRYLSAKDTLDRIIIRSPVDGVVNMLIVHTKGGVIGPGAKVAEISPANDKLVIEAKIPHKDIQSIHVGLDAKIRFSAFKSRTSPSFTGKVVSLSPDIVEDRMAAAQFPNQMMGGDGKFYVAIIELDMEEFEKVAAKKNLELHPGMQAEIQIVRGSRTLLRYLLDPVLDTMFNALKEK